jgi:hypothetical protein
MTRLLTNALLGIALLVPVAAPIALRAQDEHSRTYEDKDHRDRHEWNQGEDRAYRNWLKENHRNYQEFNRLNERDQAAYWNWRHSHPDNDRDHRTEERH